MTILRTQRRRLEASGLFGERLYVAPQPGQDAYRVLKLRVGASCDASDPTCASDLTPEAAELFATMVNDADALFAAVTALEQENAQLRKQATRKGKQGRLVA